MNKIHLKDGESIVAVVPEYASGPGWSNSPLWVYIRHRVGTFRTECIQPEDQTASMDVLFSVLVAAHSRMLAEVRRHTANE